MGTVQRKMAVLLLCFAGISGCGYNTLQQREEEVFKAWADVESNFQRRADLIPNLVEVVRGYAQHEQQTLKAVIEARGAATSVKLSTEDLSNPEALKRLQQVQGELSSTLSRLIVLVERYPDLKANQSFMDLQNQLEGTENRINISRERYNRAVAEFNASIRKFPYNLTNSLLLHLQRKEYFRAEEGAREAPKVKF